MQVFGKDLIKKIKAAELTGERSHCIYSPPYRPLYSEEEIFEKNPKLAAVNILLYLKDDRWYFPLILRSENEKDRHSGQVSLPGGKKEEADLTFRETAVRETEEEIGVDRHYIRVIRELSPIYIPPSNFYVHTYISFTKKNPAFTLQEGEAVELIEFPIESILNLDEEPEMMALPSSRGIEVPVITFENYIIWGATSMILSEFRQLLKNL